MRCPDCSHRRHLLSPTRRGVVIANAWSLALLPGNAGTCSPVMLPSNDTFEKKVQCNMLSLYSVQNHRWWRLNLEIQVCFYTIVSLCLSASFRLGMRQDRDGLLRVVVQYV